MSGPSRRQKLSMDEGFLEVDTKKLWEPMTSSISLSKGKLYIHSKFSRDLPCCCVKCSVQISVGVDEKLG